MSLHSSRGYSRTICTRMNILKLLGNTRFQSTDRNDLPLTLWRCEIFRTVQESMYAWYHEQSYHCRGHAPSGLIAFGIMFSLRERSVIRAGLCCMLYAAERLLIIEDKRNPTQLLGKGIDAIDCDLHQAEISTAAFPWSRQAC
jgi:hypothetical protein